MVKKRSLPTRRFRSPFPNGKKNTLPPLHNITSWRALFGAISVPWSFGSLVPYCSVLRLMPPTRRGMGIAGVDMTCDKSNELGPLAKITCDKSNEWGPFAKMTCVWRVEVGGRRFQAGGWRPQGLQRLGWHGWFGWRRAARAPEAGSRRLQGGGQRREAGIPGGWRPEVGVSWRPGAWRLEIGGRRLEA